MRSNRDIKAIYAVLGALQRALGDHLTALYSFGGISACTYCTSPDGINLLVVISDNTRMQDVSQALRQVWRLHSAELGQVPLVARRASFLRHLKLDPILAYDLVATGEKLAGESLLTDYPIPDPIELLARIASETMRASAVLAPTMISQQESDRAVNSLRCLAKEYLAEDYSPADPPAKIYSGVQRYTAYQVGRYDGLAWNANEESRTAPVLEVLLSVYSMDNRLLLVLPDLPADELADRIASTDWRSVASRIAGEYRGLRLTTPAQLRLVLQLERAADFTLGTFELAWGVDLLSDMEINRWRILRDLARLPSDILIDTLPRSLIVCNDSDLPVLVHDLQNKLLNIQLRTELFSRMEYSVAEMPPVPLPDRSAPNHVRIEAIANQLDWWADYYHQEMDSALTLIGQSGFL
ncbi:MAG: hypothetical protein WA996_07000 [Candidatus Promineifilaceae bacterium]